MSDTLREELERAIRMIEMDERLAAISNDPEGSQLSVFKGLLQRCSLKIEEQANEIEQLEIEAYGINP